MTYLADIKYIHPKAESTGHCCMLPVTHDSVDKASAVKTNSDKLVESSHKHRDGQCAEDNIVNKGNTSETQWWSRAHDMLQEKNGGQIDNDCDDGVVYCMCGTGAKVEHSRRSQNAQ